MVNEAKKSDKSTSKCAHIEDNPSGNDPATMLSNSPAPNTSSGSPNPNSTTLQSIHQLDNEEEAEEELVGHRQSPRQPTGFYKESSGGGGHRLALSSSELALSSSRI